MNTSWNIYWDQDANRQYWLEPDASVIDLVQNMDRTAVKDVLDLGCGIGRHSFFMSKQGFNVTAVDSSLTALSELYLRAQSKNDKISIIQGNYLDDLFVEDSFDLVLAFNVIYHGSRNTMAEAIRLAFSWLRPGGFFFFTCPTLKDAKYGSGELVALDTFRPLNSIHPGDIHYFASDENLKLLMKGFDIVNQDVFEHYWENKGVRQFSSYRRVLAAKLG